MTDRVTVLDVLDRVNLIRPAEGIGIFQSAYGPRLTMLNTLTIPFSWGGQRRRIGIARALALGPELIVATSRSRPSTSRSRRRSSISWSTS